MLNQKQAAFSAAIGHFLVWLSEEGYWAVFGEAFRPADVAALYAQQKRGVNGSNHCLRLAIDLILFRNGTELKTFWDYLDAGTYWESLSNDKFTCTWGGRFLPLVDCVHFSFEHNGVK